MAPAANTRSAESIASAFSIGVDRLGALGWWCQVRTMIFEYPRDAPDGEQMAFEEVMEIADVLIQQRCVSWGWRGSRMIQDDADHK